MGYDTPVALFVKYKSYLRDDILQERHHAFHVGLLPNNIHIFLLQVDTQKSVKTFSLFVDYQNTFFVDEYRDSFLKKVWILWAQATDEVHDEYLDESYAFLSVGTVSSFGTKNLNGITSWLISVWISSKRLKQS